MSEEDVTQRLAARHSNEAIQNVLLVRKKYEKQFLMQMIIECE